MFKKENSSFSEGKKETSLRKSDIRKLLSTFKSSYPINTKTCSSSGDEEEDRLNNLLNHIFTIPSSSSSAKDTILKRKIPSHTNVWLYLRTPTADVSVSDEGDTRTKWPYTKDKNSINQPLLLEMENPSNSKKKLLIPCLALLSVFPDLLPIVHVYSKTSKYLCRRADLMKVGVLDITTTSPPEAKQKTLLRKGSLVSICVVGNSQPFAVGFLMDDSNNMHRGKRGIAVEIVTCYGDDLWKSQVGNFKNFDNNEQAYLARNFFNPGFINGEKVISEESGCGIESESDEEEDNNMGDDIKGKNEDVAVENEDEEGSNNDFQSEKEQTQTEQEMQNELLMKCFMKAIIMPKEPLGNLDKKPLLVSVFYAKHILAARPPDVTIDLKKTTYKKFGNFLLKQAEIGLIKLRPSQDKKDKVAFISEIDKSHELIQQARKELMRDPNNITIMNNSCNKEKQSTMVIDLYCIPAHFTRILRLNPDDVNAMNVKSTGRRGTGYLTLPEARQILNKYLRDNLLINNGLDPDLVELDGPLLEALYKKPKKGEAPSNSSSGSGLPLEILKITTRREIMEKWIENIDIGHAFIQTPEKKILSMKRGPPEKIKITVLKLRGYTTIVTGLEMYVESFSGDSFVRDVSRRFACAGVVTTKLRMKGGEVLQKGCVALEFRGHLLEELTALLMGGDTRICSHGGVKDSPYNLPKGVIDSVLGKGVSKKKKKR